MTSEKNGVNQGPPRDPDAATVRYRRMDALEKLAVIIADEIAESGDTSPVVLSSEEFCIDYGASLLRTELSKRKISGVNVATSGEGSVYHVDSLVAEYHLLD